MAADGRKGWEYFTIAVFLCDDGGKGAGWTRGGCLLAWVQEMEDVMLISLSVGLGLGLAAMEGVRWR